MEFELLEKEIDKIICSQNIELYFDEFEVDDPDKLLFVKTNLLLSSLI